MSPPSRAAPARTTPTGHRSLTDREPSARARAVKDRSARAVLLAGMAIALIPLALIFFEVVRRGAGVIGLEFFTQVEPPYRREGGGYAQGFVGTAYIMALAIGMAVPMGIAAAVYLTEYGHGKLATLVRFFTDVMTGVPSVFVGLFIYSLLVVGPAQLRFGTLLPAAGPGLVTGSMLAVARGAGETAPLLLTALGSLQVVTALQGTAQSSLTLLIYRGAIQPFEAGIQRAWGGALALLGFVLLFTVAARLIGARAVALRR